jgi:hypothetical protein
MDNKHAQSPHVGEVPDVVLELLAQFGYPPTGPQLHVLGLVQIVLPSRPRVLLVGHLLQPFLLPLPPLACFLQLHQVLPVDHHLRFPLELRLFDVIEVLLRGVEVNFEQGSLHLEPVLVGRHSGVGGARFEERRQRVEQDQAQEQDREIEASLPLPLGLAFLVAAEGVRVSC